MESSVAVLQEKVNRVEREIIDIKKDIREQNADLDSLLTTRETILLRLDQIQKQLGDIQGTVNKDSGWRGFFLDFIKAAAQIAALVGAGKFIF